MPTEWSIRAITRAMLPVLLALTLVEIGSGLVLDAFETTLQQAPSLLVLVPVIIGTAGNLGSILASRLSTALHLGLFSFALDDETLIGNAVATVALAASVFPIIGVGAWALTVLAVPGGAKLAVTTVVLVSSLSGLALALLAIAVTLIATYVAYRLGSDPDDVVIPVVTNVCDVLGVLVLFATVRLVV